MTEERNMSLISNPGYAVNGRLAGMGRHGKAFAEPAACTDLSKEYFENGVITDMSEGMLSYRVRYCLPDYELFLKQGSKFLELKPPADIWEAVGNLICLYHNILDDGGIPIYIGRPDRLLEPFVKDWEEAEKAIRFLMVHVDRTISNTFCHMNLGPEDTKAGRLILKLTKELKQPCPNLTVMCRPDMPDDFLRLAVETAMTVFKPGFVNDLLYRKDVGDYGVVSDYNTLPIGGCGLALVQINLNRLPGLSIGPEHLLNTILPKAVRAACDVIDCLCSFIVDDCRYYENTFLYKEGLIKKDKNHMVGLVGFSGLEECVNGVLGLTKPEERFGRGRLSDAFGVAVMERIRMELDGRPARYGRYGLQAQGRVMGAEIMASGGRVSGGEEPDLFFQLRNFIRMHKGCDAGCGGLFPVDETMRERPEYLMHILKGAFLQGARYMSFYSGSADGSRGSLSRRAGSL